MTEILNLDGTSTLIDRLDVKKGDIFRGHCPGEGTGPWMIAESDARRTDKGISVKAAFYTGPEPGPFIKSGKGG